MTGVSKTLFIVVPFGAEFGEAMEVLQARPKSNQIGMNDQQNMKSTDVLHKQIIQQSMEVKENLALEVVTQMKAITKKITGMINAAADAKKGSSNTPKKPKKKKSKKKVDTSITAIEELLKKLLTKLDVYADHGDNGLKHTMTGDKEDTIWSAWEEMYSKVLEALVPLPYGIGGFDGLRLLILSFECCCFGNIGVELILWEGARKLVKEIEKLMVKHWKSHEKGKLEILMDKKEQQQ